MDLIRLLSVELQRLSDMFLGVFYFVTIDLKMKIGSLGGVQI